MKLLFLLVLNGLFFCSVYSDDWDEFKVKRESDFKFTSEPSVLKTGDNQYSVSFEAASYCDVTIVVEEKETGRILAHLASGVLGKNAPVPFQKNSKKQILVWDCKDDKGEYIKDFANIQFRVSLGLAPKFNKDFFHSSYKRYGHVTMRMCSTKDGVYVYDGGGSWDYIRLYSHDGVYKKTVYPIDAAQLQKTKGMDMQEFPDKSGEFPVKPNFLQNSFFKDGSNSGGGAVSLESGKEHYGMRGKGASFLTANDQKVVAGMGRVHSIGVNGTELSEPFYGPIIGEMFDGNKKGEKLLCPPLAASISPDGNKIYFAAMHHGNFKATATPGLAYNGSWDTAQSVKVLDVPSGEISIFKGTEGFNHSGKDENSFNTPMSVFVDENNRVYVADHLNDRVQIYDQSGKFLKSISVVRPAYVTVLRKSKQIVVGSFSVEVTMPKGEKNIKVPTKIAFYGTFEHLKKGDEIEVPKKFDKEAGSYLYSGDGLPLCINVNDDAGDIYVWFCEEGIKETRINIGKQSRKNVEVYKLKNKKLELVKSFDEAVKKDLVYNKVFQYGRMRIFVNPKTGNLFIATTMFGFNGKAFKEIIEIDVNTGKQQVHKTPFDAEDMAFDSDGYLYLKSTKIMARYEVESWREVPFDYGIEAMASTSSSSDRVVGTVISGIELPYSSSWHHGGFYISPKGYIVTSGPYIASADDIGVEEDEGKVENELDLTIYPGRSKFSKMSHLVHVFDKFGKVFKLDLLQGLTDIYGIGIDQDKNVYVMSGATRVLNGKRYENLKSGTIIKLSKDGVRSLSAGGTIPIPESDIPKREADVMVGNKKFWLNGAEWFYGGVGFAGKNPGVGCACFNARMTFDYLNRTFAPELERYRVAVLDSAGNLICHIGQYGNVDSKGEKSISPLGGDEVGLMHGAFLATSTDKFLYISDVGNDRIVQVKLNYHLSKTIEIPTSK